MGEIGRGTHREWFACSNTSEVVKKQVEFSHRIFPRIQPAEFFSHLVWLKCGCDSKNSCETVPEDSPEPTRLDSKNVASPVDV